MTFSKAVLPLPALQDRLPLRNLDLRKRDRVRPINRFYSTSWRALDAIERERGHRSEGCPGSLSSACAHWPIGDA